MKISANPLFSSLAAFATLLVVCTEAAPSSSPHHARGAAPEENKLAKRMCGSTNYCEPTQMYPGCTSQNTGYQVCGIKYPQRSWALDMCIYCVDKNCNDRACAQVF